MDAGPHPHPAKAAEGKRLRRLEADPVTAPVVQRIFAMYAAGAGLRTIAEALAQEGIASPAAHDPARNRHRDTSGWSHSAVLNIVKNPTYSGYRVWGKQHKQDVLVDPGDVAAGYQARMRWTDEQDWIRSEHQTHPALVDTEVLKKAQARLRDGKTNTQALRPTARGRIYPLRGLIECGACGHRMQGIYKPPRSAGAAERYIYRCELRKQRSLPPDAFPDHPNVLTVRQAALLPLIDQWLTSLAVPATFTQLPDDAAIVTARQIRSGRSSQRWTITWRISSGSPPSQEPTSRNSRPPSETAGPNATTSPTNSRCCERSHGCDSTRSRWHPTSRPRRRHLPTRRPNNAGTSIKPSVSI